jgi:hypothetical protein
MYLGLEGRCIEVLEPNSLAKRETSLDASGKAALSPVTPNREEKLDELLEPVVPDSEQFNLQQSFAIETDGVRFSGKGFLTASRKIRH